MARRARVLARNLRRWPGELDLVVELDRQLVAVEVKTRVGAEPVEEFTAEKAARLRRAGARLPRRPDRYDLVTVRLSADGADVRWLPGVC
jgi:Holliday junction resolvase-like predicted endonuclease